MGKFKSDTLIILEFRGFLHLLCCLAAVAPAVGARLLQIVFCASHVFFAEHCVVVEYAQIKARHPVLCLAGLAPDFARFLRVFFDAESLLVKRA